MRVPKAVIVLALLTNLVVRVASLTSQAQEPPQYSPEGRWNAEHLTGPFFPIQNLNRISLVGDETLLWARATEQDRWRFVRVHQTGPARELFEDDREFAIPDGIAKRMSHLGDQPRLEFGATGAGQPTRATFRLVASPFRGASHANLIYVGCARMRLRKYQACSDGGDGVSAMSADKTVYALEGDGLRRLLGPGDVFSAGGRMVTIKGAQIMSIGRRGAIVRYDEQSSRDAKGLALVDGKRITSLVAEGGPVPGMPSATVTDADDVRASLDRLEEVFDIQTSAGRALLRIADDEVVKIVAEGDVVGGNRVTGFSRIAADGPTVALIAQVTDAPDQLLLHHQGRLIVAGSVEPRLRGMATARSLHRMVLLGGVQPSVVLSFWPDASHKEHRVLLYDSRELKEIDLGPLAETVRALRTGITFPGYELKALPWIGKVAIRGMRQFQEDAAGKLAPLPSTWLLDPSDPTAIRLAPRFLTGGAVVDVSDVISWPRPDVVLAATDKGLYRLTRQ